MVERTVAGHVRSLLLHGKWQGISAECRDMGQRRAPCSHVRSTRKAEPDAMARQTEPTGSNNARESFPNSFQAPSS